MTSVSPLSQWLEDTGVNWGGHVSPNSTCPLCRLSLLSIVSDLEPGVIALHCGEWSTMLHVDFVKWLSLCVCGCTLCMCAPHPCMHVERYDDVYT